MAERPQTPTESGGEEGAGVGVGSAEPRREGRGEGSGLRKVKVRGPGRGAGGAAPGTRREWVRVGVSARDARRQPRLQSL